MEEENKKSADKSDNIEKVINKEKNNNNEEKKPIKIRLSTAIFCFIILALAMGIGFMYLYYNKKENNNNSTALAQNEISTVNDTKENKVENKIGINSITQNSTNSVSNTVVNNNSQASASEALDINNELVKKLYNYILISNDNSGKLVYKPQKTVYQTIDADVEVLTVFENLDKKLATKTEDNTYETTYTYTKETFLNKAKEIFGDDVKLAEKNFSYELLARKVSCEDGVYKDSYFQGGGDVPWKSAHKIEKAEKINDEIIITDKYVYMYNDNTTSKEAGNGIYSSSEKTGKIIDGIDITKIYEGISYSATEEVLNNKIVENIEKMSNNKVKKYKHTFKKKVDGTYYWYSTEPIE